MTNGMTRRETMMAGMAAGTAAVLADGVVDDAKADLAPAPHWLTLLGKSERGGRDNAPHVEGRIPEGLNGSLYRNGPGSSSAANPASRIFSTATVWCSGCPSRTARCAIRILSCARRSSTTKTAADAYKYRDVVDAGARRLLEQYRRRQLARAGWRHRLSVQRQALRLRRSEPALDARSRNAEDRRAEAGRRSEQNLHDQGAHQVRSGDGRLAARGLIAMAARCRSTPSRMAPTGI